MNQIEAKKRKIEYFSYIVGLISFILLGYLIGYNGITYMAVLIECISLFVLAVNGSSTDAIGMLLRSRRKKGLYKEAGELHKTILLIHMIMAGVLTVAYFFLTDVLANVVFHMPFLSIAMKLLTPVILLKTWQCAMLGYFQGQGSHMPSVVCCVFRQLLFLLFSLLFTGKLVDYGTRVAGLLNHPDYAGMYGAVGLCLAMVISEIFISIFLLIVYVGSDKKSEKKKSADGMQKMDSLGDRCRLVLAVSFREAGKEILKKLPFVMGILFVLWKMEDISIAARSYGLFFGGFVCVCAIPIFLVVSRMLNIFSALNVSVKRKEKRLVREVICAGLHYCWAAALFVAVCMAVLAPQLCKILHPDAVDVLQKYYMYGAGAVVVLIVTIFLGKVLAILEGNLMAGVLPVIFNVIFLLCNMLLRERQPDAILALCLSVLLTGTVLMVVSFVYILRKYVLQPDMVRGFFVPMIGAAVMGLLSMLLQNVLEPHVSSAVCLLLCLAVSFIVYWAVLLLSGSIRENKVTYVYGPVGRKILGLIGR